MINYYILCKHLTEAVEKQQPLDRHIQLIIDAVKSQQFDVVEEDIPLEVVKNDEL